METELNCPQEFEIRQPRWILAVSIITHIAFVGITAFIIKQRYDGVYTAEQTIAMIISLSVILFFLGTLALISFCRDTFKYTNGEFLCKRVLHRTKKWNIDDVSSVVLMKHSAEGLYVYTIVFLDKNNKVLARVTDGRWVWEDGSLRQLLFHYNISTTYKYAIK